jgi:hypothetical protein
MLGVSSLMRVVSSCRLTTTCSYICQVVSCISEYVPSTVAGGPGRHLGI